MKAIKQRSVDLLGENVTPGQGLPQERGQILQSRFQKKNVHVKG